MRTAPIAFFASWLTLDVSYRITSQFATGPAGVAFSCKGPGGMLSPCWTGQALGWQGTYYLHDVRSRTAYVGAHAYYDSYTSYPHDSINTHEKVRGVRAHAFVGYAFQAPANVLWHLGVGWEVRSYDRTTLRTDSSGASYEDEATQTLSNPMLEAKIGYQF